MSSEIDRYIKIPLPAIEKVPAYARPGYIATAPEKDRYKQLAYDAFIKFKSHILLKGFPRWAKEKKNEEILKSLCKYYGVDFNFDKIYSGLKEIMPKIPEIEGYAS
jgi:hypothetical protein